MEIWMGLFEITPAAREELVALSVHPENRGKGIRVFVEGMPHDEKTCWILFEEKARPVDRVFVDGDLTLIVGPESAWYLKGKELDYEDEESGSGSFFITPIPGYCECYDEEEWAYLDELPAEEEPWDDDDWELVADDDDEMEPERIERPTSDERPVSGNRLPRGWRPAP
jgi:Fe-S cluster assembly iron-binding protein IscA